MELIHISTLQWRHYERHGVSNHQRLDCLLRSLFRHRSKKTSKLRVTGLCEGNSSVTGEVPIARASNAENVSIRWRHLEKGPLGSTHWVARTRSSHWYWISIDLGNELGDAKQQYIILERVQRHWFGTCYWSVNPEFEYDVIICWCTATAWRHLKSLANRLFVQHFVQANNKVNTV